MPLQLADLQARPSTFDLLPIAKPVEPPADPAAFRQHLSRAAEVAPSAAPAAADKKPSETKPAAETPSNQQPAAASDAPADKQDDETVAVEGQADPNAQLAEETTLLDICPAAEEETDGDQEEAVALVDVVSLSAEAIVAADHAAQQQPQIEATVNASVDVEAVEEPVAQVLQPLPGGNPILIDARETSPGEGQPVDVEAVPAEVAAAQPIEATVAEVPETTDAAVPVDGIGIATPTEDKERFKPATETTATDDSAPVNKEASTPVATVAQVVDESIVAANTAATTPVTASTGEKATTSDDEGPARTRTNRFTKKEAKSDDDVKPTATAQQATEVTAPVTPVESPAAVEAPLPEPLHPAEADITTSDTPRDAAPTPITNDREAAAIRTLSGDATEPRRGTSGVSNERRTEAGHKPGETPESVDTIDRARFAQRVARALHSAQQRNGEIRLRLSPPELGSLRVELTIDKGALTARLEAETPAARSILLESVSLLRDRLAEQDIRVAKFDVEVADHSHRDQSQHASDQGQQHWQRPQFGSEDKSRRGDTPAAAAAPRKNSKPGNDGRLNVVI